MPYPKPEMASMHLKLSRFGLSRSASHQGSHLLASSSDILGMSPPPRCISHFPTCFSFCLITKSSWHLFPPKCLQLLSSLGSSHGHSSSGKIASYLDDLLTCTLVAAVTCSHTDCTAARETFQTTMLTFSFTCLKHFLIPLFVSFRQSHEALAGPILTMETTVTSPWVLGLQVCTTLPCFTRTLCVLFTTKLHPQDSFILLLRRS